MSLTFSSGPNCSTRARRTRRPANNQRTARRLTLEPLEERALLAVVSHWTAENTVLDSVGPNHGSLVSGAAYAAGQVNQAFSFDGVNDRVQVADSPSLALTQSMTIEAWVKCTALPTEQSMIYFRGDDRGGLDPYVLNVKPDGTVRFEIASLTSGAGLQALLPLNQFVQVAATLDDGTGAMKLYLNGVLVAQTTTTVRPFADLDPNSNPGIGIGNHGGYPTTPHNFPFHGLIDELKVYDNALTPAEVLANFNAAKGSLQPSISIDDATVTEGDSMPFRSFLGALVESSSNGGLNRSTGMTFGPDGKLYVGSLNTNEVLRYDALTGDFLGAFILAGSGGLTTPALQGLSFRPNGMLYVVSRDNSSVLRFDDTTGDYVDTFVSPNSGGLQSPKGMAFGPNGDLFLSSGGTNQVLRYDATTGDFLEVFVAAGSGGLTNPRALAFGPDGNLYVSSSDTDAVLKYDGVSGALMGTFIAPNSGGLNFPAELLFLADSLYVASQDSNQVLRFNATTGAYIETVVSAENGLDRPIGLLADGSDHLLVGSFAEILRYGSASVASFAITLSAPFPTPVSVDFATADGTALAGSDYAATSGTLNFAAGTVTKVVAVETLNDALGELREAFSISLSSAVSGMIADGVATGTIYDDDAGTKFYVVEDSDVGTRDRTFEYADGGRGIEDYVLDKSNTKPQGAASNAAGDTIWVADYARKVFIYNPVGGLKGSWTAGSMSKWARVAGIATNGVDVWLVDNYSRKVFKYTNAASRTSGSQNAANSFSLNSANTNPTDIVTDGTHLWVVDNGPTDKVYKYTLGGSLVSSWTIDPANLNPRGITLDPTNPDHLWIVDANQRRVYEYAHAVNADNGSIRLADASFALDSRNTHPEGIADPRPLLTQTSGSQSTDAIVAMAAGNTKPRGIADRPSGAREVTILTELFREFVLSHHAHLNGRQNVTGPALRPTSAAHASSIDMCNSWLLSVTDRIASTDREISGPLQHRTQNPARRIRDELLAAWDSDQDLLSNAWMEER